MDNSFAVEVATVSEETRDIVSLLANEVATFQHIPLLIVRTDAERALQLTRVPEVLSVSMTAPDFVQIVTAYEALIGQAHQVTQASWPNGNPQVIPGGTADAISSYPYIDMSANPPMVDFDTQVRLDTRLGFMSAINMSMGLSNVDIPFSPSDPVNIATKAASRIVPVVVAAGNAYQRVDGRETMNPWAESPWVIAVGATDTSEGGNLASYSSVGTPDNPESGPMVVAYGQSGISADPRDQGTSFAAPRVASILAYMAQYCLTLRHFVQKDKGGYVEGIPIVGIGYIDEGIELKERSLPLAALPRTGIDLDALKAVLSKLDQFGLRVHTWPTPQHLRQMLVASAEPLPDLAPHEAGYGFVSYETTKRYLEQFSGADFASLFCPEATASSGVRQLLRDYRLTDTNALPHLLSVWEQSLYQWAVDLQDGQLLASPPPTAENKQTADAPEPSG